ncbi:efflux RND transporter periplasmic adaptor subunit [Nitrospirillum pindoramense]|uniref:Multidrug efflux system membrane fusion protein n=1 Tax=Nitrospirillum amazonense TaxID=28077 RepID=A0A560GR44_9PROT|nr:efflux RND transporter periplasmic adaptor subunit [Nitrospirillum amazonense]TWB36493.1 multidrug efflux system membrane fusion protein [Nitrospirillum amazonense]
MTTPRTKPARTKLVLALASGVALAAIGGFFAHGHGDAQASAPAAAAAPLAEVEVAPVLNRTVVDWQSYSGRLEAVEHVDIRPQISGPIVAVNFKNGALVKKGDLLFTIDPRPFQAAVDQAEAALSSAQSRLRFATTDLERARKLISSNAIPQRDLDDRENTARTAAADVKAAEAALEVARLNLSYTRVVAPVDGRVSRAEITVGNIVAAGAASVPLTTLVSVSPIYASFDVDEQTYLRHIASVKDGNAPVQLGLATEDGYSRTGVVEHVDNHLDTVSGTIRVRAKFDNPDGMLVPGLYARIKVGGSSPHDALLVDDRAIGTDQDKKYVLVVGDDNKVAYREVALGGMQDGLRVITKGLKAGERIVVNGVQFARPGDTVKPKNVAMAGETALPETRHAGAAL